MEILMLHKKFMDPKVYLTEQCQEIQFLVLANDDEENYVKDKCIGNFTCSI